MTSLSDLAKAQETALQEAQDEISRLTGLCTRLAREIHKEDVEYAVWVMAQEVLGNEISETYGRLADEVRAARSEEPLFVEDFV